MCDPTSTRTLSDTTMMIGINTIRESTFEKVELPLCRAVFYRALSFGFRPPTEETLARLGSVEASNALADAATCLDPHDRYHLPALARALPQAEGARELELLSHVFVILFGHTARGAVPPYETEYGSDAPFLQPQELSDIAGFFRAFGLVLNDASHERIDHISCECEFMGFLCEKEAYAFDNEDGEMLEETRKAQRLFLRDHLGRFARAFGRKVARADPLGLYGRLGNVCISFIESECRMFDVPVGLDALQLRPSSDDTSPMACASCADDLEPSEGDFAGGETLDNSLL